MNRTNIYLPDGLRSRLDQRAESAGVSRAEIIRQLLEQALSAEEGDLESDIDALELSFGILTDWEAPTSRTDDARMRYLDRVGRR